MSTEGTFTLWIPMPCGPAKIDHEISEVASVQHQRYRYLEAARRWLKFLLVCRCLRMCTSLLKAAIKNLILFHANKEIINPERDNHSTPIPFADFFNPLLPEWNMWNLNASDWEKYSQDSASRFEYSKRNSITLSTATPPL